MALTECVCATHDFATRRGYYQTVPGTIHVVFLRKAVARDRDTGGKVTAGDLFVHVDKDGKIIKNKAGTAPQLTATIGVRGEFEKRSIELVEPLPEIPETY